MACKNAPPTRPRFDQLPLHAGDPKVSAWGLWGEDDELGSLNMLTAERVKEAVREVRTGERIALNHSIEVFERPMNPIRKHCDHHIIPKGHANDDELHINTQGSTHWDGPRHYPYQDSLLYYNGVTQADISGPSANYKIGIQNLAEHTITGRGILLDWASWTQAQGIGYDAFAAHPIPHKQLLAVATSQGVVFRPGDILLVRTGWWTAFASLSREDRLALPFRPVRSSIGLEASEEAIAWHWDCGFAAVASDTVAYEAWPSTRPYGVSMHEAFLAGWGMPIGESFNLEELARRCGELGRWSFLFVSVPLNVPGGVASPPNAVAIL